MSVGVWRTVAENVDVIATAVVESKFSGALKAGAGNALAKTTSSSNVTSIGRSPPNLAPGNVSLVATSYQNGDVRLFSYPCTNQHVVLFNYL